MQPALRKSEGAWACLSSERGEPSSDQADPPPNLLSSFSWPYGYIYIYINIYIYIYIYIYRSEGFARTGYFIPVRDGMGVGPGWEILPPPYKGPPNWYFVVEQDPSQNRSRIEISTRYCLEIAQNCVPRLFCFSSEK